MFSIESPSLRQSFEKQFSLFMCKFYKHSHMVLFKKLLFAVCLILSFIVAYGVLAVNVWIEKLVTMQNTCNIHNLI